VPSSVRVACATWSMIDFGVATGASNLYEVSLVSRENPLAPLSEDRALQWEVLTSLWQRPAGDQPDEIRGFVR